MSVLVVARGLEERRWLAGLLHPAQVWRATDPAEALRVFAEHTPEGCVLFAGADLADTRAALSKLRRAFGGSLFVVGPLRAEARACCLDDGADDCLSPQQAEAELALRLRRRLARLGGDDALWCGPLSYSARREHFSLAGEVLALSSTERRLLLLLLRHAPRAVPATELAQAIWSGASRSAATLDAHYYNLRAKLAGSGAAGLLSRSPAGYRLDPGG